MASSSLRNDARIILCAALALLPEQLRAEEASASVSATTKVTVHAAPLLGAGHATLLELTAIDTRSSQLNHSLGVGAFGVLSSVRQAPDRRATSAHVARFLMDWHLAGGQSGFDGLLHVDFGQGARWPAKGHGFAVRGGADLKLAGNQQYYLSSFDAPTVDAGYQYVGFGKLLELSLRTSLLWDGRFRVDSSRSMNLPTTVGWGGLLEAGSAPFWTSVQFLHGGDVSKLNADLCSQAAGNWSLCLRLDHMTQAWPWNEAARHLTTGTLGIGWAPFAS